MPCIALVTTLLLSMPSGSYAPVIMCVYLESAVIKQHHEGAV